MELFYDISVVILSLEDTPNLERCIRSCITQTLPGFSHEIIVVADETQSYCCSVLNNYEQHVTRLVENAPLSFSKALELGLRKASGRFVILVHANDFLSDYSLLFQSVFLYDNALFEGVRVDYWLVDKDSDRKLERVQGPKQPIPYGILCRKESLAKKILYHQNLDNLTEAALQNIFNHDIRVGYLPISFYRRQVA